MRKILFIPLLFLALASFGQAKTHLYGGSVANDGTGTTLRDGSVILNGNFDAVQSSVDSLGTIIGTKAPLASPTFTGDVVVPNQSASYNGNEAVNGAYVQGELTGREYYVLCTTQTATTSLTAIDIPGLSITLDASSTYVVEGSLHVGTSAATGYTVGFVSPGSANYYITIIGETTGATAISFGPYFTDGIAGTYGTSIHASHRMHFKGTITTTGGGTFKMQFASVTGGTSTAFIPGSYMHFTKIP